MHEFLDEDDRCEEVELEEGADFVHVHVRYGDGVSCSNERRGECVNIFDKREETTSSYVGRIPCPL